jgi:3-dehydroquinate synthase class II
VKALFLAALLAAGATAAVATAQTPSTPGSETKQDAKKGTTRNVSGTVKASSPDAVVVAGKDKGQDAEWTFAVEPVTNIRKGGKSITAADLKAGDAVQVRYTEREGKAMAQSILVGTAAKPK